MAKSISDEELQLRKRARRRLIGAIAVVTIVAVFLPMVLDHEPRPVSQDVSIRIPSPNSGIFTSKIVPVVPGAPARSEPAKSAEAPARIEAGKIVDAPARSEPAKTAAATPSSKAVESSAPPAYDTEAAPPKKAAPEQPKPPAKPAAAPVAKPPAKTAPAPAEKPKAADSKSDAKDAAGFVVQVAALNDAEKAKQMLGQIAAAGIKSYSEVVPTAKGNVTRVRAGPFATREDAEKMRDKLKGMGLSGNIVPK